MGKSSNATKVASVTKTSTPELPEELTEVLGNLPDGASNFILKILDNPEKFIESLPDELLELASGALERRGKNVQARITEIAKKTSKEDFEKISKEMKEEDVRKTPTYHRLLGTVGDSTSDQDALRAAARITHLLESASKAGVDAKLVLPEEPKKDGFTKREKVIMGSVGGAVVLALLGIGGKVMYDRWGNKDDSHTADVIDIKQAV